VPDAQISVSPDYQVGLAERIRKEPEMMSAAVGLITDPAQANSIVPMDGQIWSSLAASECAIPIGRFTPISR
jgi:hypothetical protein